MAVIIDGWDKLPQNCYDCDLQNYHECCLTCNSIEDYINGEDREPSCPLKEVPTGKIFEKIIVENADIKPYYNIQYKENGEGFIGYGSYNIDVISGYLRRYFFMTEQEAENVVEE